MTTPQRGLLFHFTHRRNLASIAEEGLFCDDTVTVSNRNFKEVGNPDIKSRRRARPVRIPPAGKVADYVPFYFAARSPMLYMIDRNAVPSYTGGQDKIVYLVTSVDSIAKHGLEFVFTDRNAALATALFSNDLAELDDYVDWDLMEAQMWRDTAEYPDKKERRMAEMLVHRHVPWAAINAVAVKTKEQKRHATAVLANVGANTKIRVQPDWYF